MSFVAPRERLTAATYVIPIICSASASALAYKSVIQICHIARDGSPSINPSPVFAMLPSTGQLLTDLMSRSTVTMRR